jgi:putative transposase
MPHCPESMPTRNPKITAGNADRPISADKTAIQENGAPRTALGPQKRNGVVNYLEIGWHSRGYLPHFEGLDVTQHVTFNLADSLPRSALRRLEDELRVLPAENRDIERRKRIDAWIDAGHGSCALRKSSIAAMVQETMLTFDSERYRLFAWVVMPNHVHVLFQPLDGWTVQKIVAAWKKFTARKICDDRRATGELSNAPVWHREYWDRYIRDRKHFDKTVEYVHLNPVKARLVATPENWPWSSAFPGNAHLPIGEVPICQRERRNRN